MNGGRSALVCFGTSARRSSLRYILRDIISSSRIHSFVLRHSSVSPVIPLISLYTNKPAMIQNCAAQPAELKKKSKEERSPLRHETGHVKDQRSNLEDHPSDTYHPVSNGTIDRR